MNKNQICVVKITQGGAIAAPIASQVLGEVLPYLEVQKLKTQEDITETIEMPNVIDLTISEAKKILKEMGIEAEINGEGENVTDQLPKKGIQINSGSKAIIYTE